MTQDEYLQHAEDCEQLAAIAKLEANRNALLASAEMWRQLAAVSTPGDGADTNHGQQVVSKSG